MRQSARPLRLRELDREQDYEAELAECAGVTGFHRWFFLRALSDALGLRFRAFAVDCADGPLGVVPVLLRRRGPVSTANYLPVPHVGPVLRNGRLAETLNAIDPFLLRARAVVTKWGFAPAPGAPADQACLSRKGYEVTRLENFVVPRYLSPEKYLAGLAPKVRGKLRQGESRGLLAGPSTPEEIMQWLPGQVSAPYARQGTLSDYSATAARELAERLAGHPRMLWRSVRNGDRMLVMNVSIVDDRVWGWLMAGKRVPGPSPQMMAYWDAVQWSLSRGLACDFGGAPTPGIRAFKVQMGGEPECCWTAERVRPRAYRTARALQARMSRRQRN
jgi:hypothetical protein